MALNPALHSMSGEALPGRADSRRHGRRRLHEQGPGRAVRPSQRGTVHRHAADPASGDQQSQPGLCGARRGRVRRRWPRAPRQLRARWSGPCCWIPRPAFPTWRRPPGARCANRSCALPPGRGPSARRRTTASGPCRIPPTTRYAPGTEPDAVVVGVQFLPAALHAARQIRSPNAAWWRLNCRSPTKRAWRGYLNFVAIYVDRGWEDLQTSYPAEIAVAERYAGAGRAHRARVMAGDAFDRGTAAGIARAVAAIPAERPRDRVRAAITLVAAAPDYLVQR